MPDLTAEVTAAIDDGRWSDAVALLDAAGEAASTPELLELRARAAYGLGDLEGSIGAWEDLHRVLGDAGDDAGAARAAAMVAMFLMIDTGLMSPVRGWLRRAEGLLAGHDEAPAHAVIAAVRTYERFMCGDLAESRRQAELAIERSRRLDVPAAEVIGRTARARVTILEGDVADGLAQLDEVGVLLLSGAVDALTTGMMLCELVCAAQGLALHDMAAEWTDAMDRWRHGAAFGGLHGRCRVHRAEILRVSGPCEAAEDEALAACDDLRPWMRREFGWPLAELGTIRLRKGDLDGAEEALLAAHEHVWCPHPGLALLRLEQGRVDEAVALIDEAIAHPFDAPSKERPPSSELTLAPLHEARAEIAVAIADPAMATEAAQALAAIAATYPGPWLAASAALAEARAALLTDDGDRAAAAASAAVAGWGEVGAPYETARARLVLADAHDAGGRSATARLEREAAARALDAFGARRWAARARALVDAGEADSSAGAAPTPSPGPDGQGAPPTDDAGPERTAVFRLEGDTRTVRFGGEAVLLRDLKGFRYLARLLTAPGRELHVLDLVAAEQGTLPTVDPSAVGAPEVEGLDGSGLPALDDEARDAYRRRLAEVEDDLAEAERNNDPGRAELAERDRAYLVAELARAVGLGGRMRSVGGDAERARTAVTRALRYAVDRLREHDPALGAHLDNSLRTGTYCSYQPDPLTPVAWST